MNIRVNLNTHINDGTEVVFRSPVDCSQITGLVVYYIEDGNICSKEFALADSHGNNVGDIDHLFAENVVVKVILDVTSGMAFVQNADTNAYLEGRFDSIPGKRTDEGGEIFNFYTDQVYTGDNPPKEYPGNTANKGAHAQNFGTHADGEYSSASGWCSTASGGISNASGRETLASGYASTTEGWLTKATNSCAHAGGKETEATGANSFAHGLKAKATNSNAVATGEGTEASGYCANASGYMTKASGTCSSTFGRDTEAQQYASSAMGRGTIATARNQSVRGAYNIPDTVDSNGNGEYAEIVGGGTNANSRKNIYTLDWAGNAEFAGSVYASGKKLATMDDIPSASGGSSIWTESTTHPGCFYRMVGNEHEWLNPPLLLGVEYRTAERYGEYAAEPVYAKHIQYSVEILGEIGTSKSYSFAHGIENFKNQVRWYGSVDNFSLPYNGWAGSNISLMGVGLFTSSNVLLQTYNQSLSNVTVNLTIYYTKRNV